MLYPLLVCLSLSLSFSLFLTLSFLFLSLAKSIRAQLDNRGYALSRLSIYVSPAATDRLHPRPTQIVKISFRIARARASTRLALRKLVL